MEIPNMDNELIKMAGFYLANQYSLILELSVVDFF